MKPSDIYLGVVDFFSTLVPGAIAAFLLTSPPQSEVFGQWPFVQRGSPEAWVVFLTLAYVLGHMIAAVAGAVLDPLYDRVYARWQRATAAYVRSTLPAKASYWEVIRARIGHVARKTNPDDPLLSTAKVLKRQQLNDVARAAEQQPEDVTNTFWWAGTVVRLKTPAGAAEIDALSAQSKLFRGIVVVAALTPFVRYPPTLPPSWVWIALIGLSLWRFMSLRWGATERTYEYFIAVSVLPSEKEPKPPAA